MIRYSVTIEFDYPESSKGFITGLIQTEINGLLFEKASNIKVKTKIIK